MLLWLLRFLPTIGVVAMAGCGDADEGVGTFWGIRIVRPEDLGL